MIYSFAYNKQRLLPRALPWTCITWPFRPDTGITLNPSLYMNFGSDVLKIKDIKNYTNHHAL